MLKTRIKWHLARQSVLAQNAANANTPGFRPSDLAPMDTRSAKRPLGLAPVATAQTHQAHIAGSV
jgi:flagellar basal-body rod protein FlgB